MIVLDASVLIGYLNATDAHYVAAQELLEGVADDELMASTVTIAESLVTPATRGHLDHAQSVLEDLGVGEVPLGKDASVRLAILRAETRLKLPDCCVLLAAEDARADVASFDDRLRRAARSRRIPVVPLRRGSR